MHCISQQMGVAPWKSESYIFTKRNLRMWYWMRNSNLEHVPTYELNGIDYHLPIKPIFCIHNRKSFCKSYWNWNSFLIHFPNVCKKECFRYDFLNVQKVMDILHVFEKKILWSVSCIQSRKKVPFPTSLKSNKSFLKFKNVDMI